jgi:hypothetical protein
VNSKGQKKLPALPPPSVGKGTPRTVRQLPSTTRYDDAPYFVVRWSMADLESTWCISKISPDHHVDLVRRIGQLEKSTATEVFDGGTGKDYSLDDGLPNSQANQRLRALNLDDWDRISRISLAGKPRLYGLRRGHEFFALWWDPKHEIWPSKLKNT